MAVMTQNLSGPWCPPKGCFEALTFLRLHPREPELQEGDSPKLYKRLVVDVWTCMAHLGEHLPSVLQYYERELFSLSRHNRTQIELCFDEFAQDGWIVQKSWVRGIVMRL